MIDFYHWPTAVTGVSMKNFPGSCCHDKGAAGAWRRNHGFYLACRRFSAVKTTKEMKQQNMLVKSNSGVDVQMIFHGNNAFMDATNPKTRRYVWEKCKQNYADLGIRTFWLDVAEPEYTSYDFENYRYYSGTVLETGNIYPREYARLFYEGQRKTVRTTSSI